MELRTTNLNIWCPFIDKIKLKAFEEERANQKVEICVQFSGTRYHRHTNVSNIRSFKTKRLYVSKNRGNRKKEAWFPKLLAELIIGHQKSKV